MKYQIIKEDRHNRTEVLFETMKDYDALTALKFQNSIYKEGIKTGLCKVYLIME